MNPFVTSLQSVTSTVHEPSSSLKSSATNKNNSHISIQQSKNTHAYQINKKLRVSLGCLVTKRAKMWCKKTKSQRKRTLMRIKRLLKHHCRC